MCTIVRYPFLAVNIRFNPYYISIYLTWMRLFVNKIIPASIMITLNTKIFHKMRSFRSSKVSTSGVSMRNAAMSRQQNSFEGLRRVGHAESELKKRDVRFTRASVFIVTAFIICNSPYIIISFGEAVNGTSTLLTTEWMNYKVVQCAKVLELPNFWAFSHSLCINVHRNAQKHETF